MSVLVVRYEEVSTKITQLAFLNRFTDTEAIDIDLASVGDSREAAQLRHFLKKVSASTFIDLGRPDLKSDLEVLVAFNLLLPERLVEILTTPVTGIEQYRG